jgi:predicted AAA+ superfamily ATPase
MSIKPEERYLGMPIIEDLKEKMVFVGGPRQVGKTTLALQCLGGKPKRPSHPAYLNWDDLNHRDRLLRGQLPSKEPIVILDEIHKFADWRNLVKGYYDRHKGAMSFLVTGSARLDHYRRGGDSLQGRYHYYRLHPFSLAEMGGSAGTAELKQLLKYGGFPEPLLKGEARFHRRWLREQGSRVLYEDLRDLERVREVSRLELLLRHLPECVGSPLSVHALSQRIGVAHETMENWISILERLYMVYRIAPFGSKLIRAVKKENKLYFWDWSRVPDGGVRFENLVAGQLLKYCHFVEDTQGYAMELRFIRDTDKREVDFVVLQDGEPKFAVECKTGERSVSPHIRYFRERTGIPLFYQVHLGDKDYGSELSDTRVLPFIRFCEELEMP